MILILTQYVTRDPSKRLRVGFGAFVASVLVPITIFLPDSFVTTSIGKVLYSFLIVWCAFGFVNARQYFKKLLFFYFISFALGGGLIALHFIADQQIEAAQSGILTFKTGYGDQISWLFVTIGFPVVWWFTKSRMDKHVIEKIRYDQLYNVAIQLKGKQYSAKGFVDSGNQLVDPLSRKPVIICDKTFLNQWFTEDELAALELAQDELSFEHIPKAWENQVSLVPYQGVDGNRSFMLVIKPELLLVSYEAKQISTSNVLIGFQFGNLTPDGSYHCLLHTHIFKNSAVSSA